jgi:hypothetical protein
VCDIRSPSGAAAGATVCHVVRAWTSLLCWSNPPRVNKSCESPDPTATEQRGGAESRAAEQPCKWAAVAREWTMIDREVQLQMRMRLDSDCAMFAREMSMTLLLRMNLRISSTTWLDVDDDPPVTNESAQAASARRVSNHGEEMS